MVTKDKYKYIVSRDISPCIWAQVGPGPKEQVLGSFGACQIGPKDIPSELTSPPKFGIRA